MVRFACQRNCCRTLAQEKSNSVAAAAGVVEPLVRRLFMSSAFVTSAAYSTVDENRNRR